ncbi:MAG: nucleotidyltransferase domain-containing protein [Dehalococcoidia bacterium]|nr:nucleotidyltransferase domain-containing protein [Dehalococcoidia bacterium]
MLQPYIISTNKQKVLSLLVKFPDQDFYEREIARRLGISTGSANLALNELFTAGVITRRQEGRMLFYSVDPSHTAITELKKLVNILLIEPLLEKLKKLASRMVLYGSCAEGKDSSASDLDLFIVSKRKKDVLNLISSFAFPKGYENIHIQAVIRTPVELMEGGEQERAFMEEIEKGITLWEKAANEPGI